MRILRVAQKAYPDVTGGGAYHVHALSRDQAAMGHNVTLLTVGDGPRREERDEYTIVRRRPLFEPLGNAIAPGIFLELRTLAATHDVIHAHSHLYFATNTTSLYRHLGSPPLAITNHGLYSQTASERLFNVYLRTVGRWTFDSADTVFCYTETERRELRDLGVRAPISIVPNGIDISRFTSPETNPEWTSKEPTVLFVGRLVDGKNPDDLLVAFDRIRDIRDDVRLIFVGDGPLSSRLQRRSEQLGLDGAVRFLGHVPHNEMPGVYRACDVLALPSRTEGVPRTILEAMASGIPVVASALPQLEPIVDGAGLTVPVGDTNELATALLEILTDQTLRREFGEHGRKQVEERYDWSDTVAKTTDVLSALATDQSPSSITSATR